MIPVFIKLWTEFYRKSIINIININIKNFSLQFSFFFIEIKNTIFWFYIIIISYLLIVFRISYIYYREKFWLSFQMNSFFGNIENKGYIVFSKILFEMKIFLDIAMFASYVKLKC